MMDIGGVTEEAVARLVVDAIGEDCPGHCAYENENGEIVRHTIDRVSELHIDVKNPLEPIALENIGILCESCNLAKGPNNFATFVWKRRAMLLAWQSAIDNPKYRVPEQTALPI